MNRTIIFRIFLAWMTPTLSNPIIWTIKMYRQLRILQNCLLCLRIQSNHQWCFRQLEKIRGLALWVKSAMGTCQTKTKMTKVSAYSRRRNWNRNPRNRPILKTMMECRLTLRMRLTGSTGLVVPWALRTSTYSRIYIDEILYTFLTQ